MPFSTLDLYTSWPTPWQPRHDWRDYIFKVELCTSSAGASTQFVNRQLIFPGPGWLLGACQLACRLPRTQHHPSIAAGIVCNYVSYTCRAAKFGLRRVTCFASAYDRRTIRPDYKKTRTARFSCQVYSSEFDKFSGYYGDAFAVS